MTRPLSPAALQRLADRIADPMPKPLLTEHQRVKAILRAVAEKHGLLVSDLLGPSTLSRVSTARFEAQWRMRTELELSYPKIGKWTGGRDHTCAMRGVKLHEARLADEARRVRP